MPCTLVVTGGSGRGRRFEFDADAVSIGRDALNDVVVNDAAVSRTHARLRRQGARWVLTDCGSANGTDLNQACVATPAEVRRGDRIGVGPVVFRFDEGRRRAWGPLWHRAAFAGGVAAILAGLAIRVAERPQRLPQPALVPMPAPAPPIPPADPAAARAAWERGRRKLEERRVAPRNLYDAWSAFREARRSLGQLQAGPPFEAELAQRIASCERDLRRDCERLLFSAARWTRYGQEERAQQALREILLRFPGDDPSGCRKLAQDRIGAPSLETAE